MNKSIVLIALFSLMAWVFSHAMEESGELTNVRDEEKEHPIYAKIKKIRKQIEAEGGRKKKSRVNETIALLECAAAEKLLAGTDLTKLTKDGKTASMWTALLRDTKAVTKLLKSRGDKQSDGNTAFGGGAMAGQLKKAITALEKAQAEYGTA